MKDKPSKNGSIEVQKKGRRLSNFDLHTELKSSALVTPSPSPHHHASLEKFSSPNHRISNSISFASLKIKNLNQKSVQGLFLPKVQVSMIGIMANQ